MTGEEAGVSSVSRVMEAKTADEVLEVICSMKEDRHDVVLTQALDLWEMEGCPLAAGGCSIIDAENNIASHAQCAQNNNKSSIESLMSMEINVG